MGVCHGVRSREGDRWKGLHFYPGELTGIGIRGYILTLGVRNLKVGELHQNVKDFIRMKRTRGGEETQTHIDKYTTETGSYA